MKIILLWLTILMGVSSKVDIREDEEQNVKLRDSIDLLLAAGYFRARIKGLSPFDKVRKNHCHVINCTHTCMFECFFS